MSPPSSGERGLSLARRIVEQVKGAIAAHRQAAKHIKAQQDALQHQQANQAYLTQLQAYLESGDPILIAEARSWLGVVNGG